MATYGIAELSKIPMKEQTTTFKRICAVMKDVNGDNRQIIKAMQEQIDYLMEFIAVQGEIIEQTTGWKTLSGRSRPSVSIGSFSPMSGNCDWP